MLPTDVQGALAAAGCALFWNGSLVMSKLMQQWQWPYFFLAGRLQGSPCNLRER